MAAGESPLSMKADFLVSRCELVVGGKEGLQPIEKTVIDLSLIHISTDVSADMLAELETALEAMDLGPLLGLWLQLSLIHIYAGLGR